MVQATTRAQIAEIEIDPQRPLLICDVDEVAVHFLRGLEDYLAENGMWLDPASFALNGNIRHVDNNEPIDPSDLGSHLNRFFAERTRHLEQIEGAAEALSNLSPVCEIIMLTNLPAAFRDDRVANLLDHGIVYPVITNSGPKGPAVAALTENHKSTVAFVDDSPNYLASVAEHCPNVELVHFMQDERFARHIEKQQAVSLLTDNWQDAHAHLAGHFAAA